MMVVGKFNVGDLVCPGTRVGPTKDPKICFNLLIDMFCFTIRLWVVCGGERYVVVEEFAKFLGKGGGELWATVRDDLVVEPKM